MTVKQTLMFKTLQKMIYLNKYNCLLIQGVIPTVIITLPGTKPTLYHAYKYIVHPDFKHVDLVPQNDFMILHLNTKVPNFQVLTYKNISNF